LVYYFRRLERKKLEINKISSFRGKYFFLSNFFPCDISHRDKTFQNVEQCFQYEKAIIFHDEYTTNKILAAPNPTDAKKLGKTIKNFNITLWNNIRKDEMFSILTNKFNNPILAEQLRQTDNAELIEGNTWGDTYWGKYNGTGQNILGKLLMEIRSAIKVNS